MTAKFDSGAKVNAIPLSKYQKIFPHKINAAIYPKQGALNPTKQSWFSHNRKSQSFLGQFITNFRHASQYKLYLMQFYIFESAMSTQILLFMPHQSA